jgi:hypothetical protein
MSGSGSPAYDDGAIACDSQGIVIRLYYFPWGTKRVPYSSIKNFRVLPLTGVNRLRRWRLWGSGDLVHWWNCDMRRPQKEVALVLDVGRRVLPSITPDDPETVERILREHLDGRAT